MTELSPSAIPSDGPLTPFPRPIPDDILQSLCRLLLSYDFKTLLVVQKTSQAAYKAATPYIYRDVHLKSDQQFASLLSSFEINPDLRTSADFEATFSEASDKESDQAVLCHPPLLDSAATTLPPQCYRSLKAFTFARSLTFEEYPSDLSGAKAAAAMLAARSNFGKRLLFPSVINFSIKGEALKRFRDWMNVTSLRSGEEMPSDPASHDFGLPELFGSLCQPRHLCLSLSRSDLNPSGVDIVDYSNDLPRACIVLSQKLGSLFPRLHSTTFHHLKTTDWTTLAQVSFSRVTRVFLADLEESPKSETIFGAEETYATARGNLMRAWAFLANLILVSIVRKEVDSENRLQINGWEKLVDEAAYESTMPPSLDPAVHDSADNSAELSSFRLPNHPFFDDLLHGKRTMPGLEFVSASRVEPCVVCGRERFSFTATYSS